MDTVVTAMNTRVLKEPLGFIRIIQLPLSILAFATTAGYSQSLEIPYSCGAATVVLKRAKEFGYPFDLTSITVPGNFCNPSSQSVILFSHGAVSQSQFFVCTGVLSFLFGLAISMVYVLYWNNYSKDPRLAMGDFLITAILAMFWFIGSCAWASGVSLVKSVTSPDAIGNRLREPKGSFPCNTDPNMCVPELTWNYASLNISLILGFACVGVWASSLWFIYKETIWYKSRTAIDVGAPGATTTGLPFGQTTTAGPRESNLRPQTSDYQY